MKKWFRFYIISPIAKFKYNLLCKIAAEQIEDARIDAYSEGWNDAFNSMEEEH